MFRTAILLLAHSLCIAAVGSAQPAAPKPDPVKAETERAKAEMVRAQAEEARAKAEMVRAQAEAERAKAEMVRAQAEAVRVKTEAAPAPVQFEFEPIPVATGGYVKLIPDLNLKTNADAVAYVSQSGVEAFPSDSLKDSRTFLLDTRGLPNGIYEFTAVATKGKQKREVKIKITVKQATIAPGTTQGHVEPEKRYTQAEVDKLVAEARIDEQTELLAIQQIATAFEMQSLATAIRELAATVEGSGDGYTVGDFVDGLKAIRTKAKANGSDRNKDYVDFVSNTRRLLLPSEGKYLLGAEQKLLVAEFCKSAAQRLEEAK